MLRANTIIQTFGDQMKKRNIIVIVVSLAVLLSAVIAYRHLDRKSKIDCVLTWGCLAEFPADLEDFEIKTEGSMFTRAFRTSFRATPDVTTDWLSQCPGIADAENAVNKVNRPRECWKETADE